VARAIRLREFVHVRRPGGLSNACGAGCHPALCRLGGPRYACGAGCQPVSAGPAACATF